MALIPFTFSSTCVYLFLALSGYKRSEPISCADYPRCVGDRQPRQAPNIPTHPGGPGDRKHRR